MSIKSYFLMCAVAGSCMVQTMDHDAKDALIKELEQATGCILKMGTPRETLESYYDCIVPAYMRQCGVAPEITFWRAVNAPGLLTKDEDRCMQLKIAALNKRVLNILNENPQS
jgi:hypothetical protein